DVLDKRLILHAVNAVYVKALNKWVRMDARGNSGSINAQFSLEQEKLAFVIHSEYGEEDGFVIYNETPDSVTHALRLSNTAQQLHENLPSYILEKDAILFTTNRPEVVMEKGESEKLVPL
ncbi:MAG: hypothetical protein ACYDG2_00640, partial [Ruminiclostridium sp.]